MIANRSTLRSSGYYKDLLNILSLAVFDQLGNPNTEFAALYSERPSWTFTDAKEKKAHKHSARRSSTPGSPSEAKSKDKLTKREKRALRTSPVPTPLELKAGISKTNETRLTAHLANSPEFKALYVAVARIFAAKLAEELDVLKTLTTKDNLENDERIALIWKIGLASKWAPTLGASHDRYTNIATGIALVLHSMGAMGTLPVPFSSIPSAPLSDADVVKVRSFYRRWIISPLRRQIQVPERNMSANAWSSIDYQRVPAVCMRQSKKQFMTHDLERFKKYLTDVSKGKRSIAGATLLPNELLGEALVNAHAAQSQPDTPEGMEATLNLQVVDGQWNALLERLRESGALDNCMALCDVSGSMGSIGSARWGSTRQIFKQPVFPAVALSILVSQLAKPPFANTFITFSDSPEIVQLNPDDSLAQTAQLMDTTAWGMTTDLQAVFLKLILPLAVKNNVKQVRLGFGVLVRM